MWSYDHGLLPSDSLLAKSLGERVQSGCPRHDPGICRVDLIPRLGVCLVDQVASGNLPAPGIEKMPGHRHTSVMTELPRRWGWQPLPDLLVVERPRLAGGDDSNPGPLDKLGDQSCFARRPHHDGVVTRCFKPKPSPIRRFPFRDEFRPSVWVGVEADDVPPIESCAHRGVDYENGRGPTLSVASRRLLPYPDLEHVPGGHFTPDECCRIGLTASATLRTIETQHYGSTIGWYPPVWTVASMPLGTCYPRISVVRDLIQKIAAAPLDVLRRVVDHGHEAGQIHVSSRAGRSVD